LRGAWQEVTPQPVASDCFSRMQYGKLAPFNLISHNEID
jgi:hypothetical protein